MKDLFQRLEKRLKERRVYKIAPDLGAADLDPVTNNLQNDHFDPSRKIPTFWRKQRKLFYSDMCVRKPGEQAALGAKWGLSLPEDYLQFCSIYGEYVLAGRNALHLENAADVEDAVVGLRQGADISLQAPYRVFHFARIVGECGYFTFRWSEDRKMMDVALIEDYAEIGEEELLGPDGDKYVTDPDFTSWLTRMLDTDCYPLVPGQREPERAGLKRIK